MPPAKRASSILIEILLDPRTIDRDKHFHRFELQTFETDPILASFALRAPSAPRGRGLSGSGSSELADTSTEASCELPREIAGSCAKYFRKARGCWRQEVGYRVNTRRRESRGKARSARRKRRKTERERCHGSARLFAAFRLASSTRTAAAGASRVRPSGTGAPLPLLTRVVGPR